MIYRKDHIPKNTMKNRRPGYPMDATTITIHNTGNPTSSAANERGWLTNPKNDRIASFHIAIDENEAVECIPLTENAWHAGDGSSMKSGNRTSIGIEICESGNYQKTLHNAAQLVANMLQERGWGVERLRRHYDWSGKICPRLMHDGGKWTGWYSFIEMVKSNLKSEPRKDEEPMTREEKAEFDKLKKTVEEQSKLLKELQGQKEIDPPTWAKEAAAYYEKEMSTLKGSYDFWRLLTIQCRKEKGRSA
ncbi:N-acetylmuramoyl-L-alanine amidase [Paenibacillus alvei]|uniref:N-acetylmuramoyl-L-alanine amidase n=1 Tax=Paenibacillus alvei TaxID=44250 RepID=A0ABT4H8S6_PAEAL|nr:N-acetylmuramoyl-L-alanine amidase [Paenibacillus alvei]EJW16239.1 N-acetylmuramoyl-L-alanine amidase CwlA [Paenibacillus alvei DSM 29]MCY9544457.1 N-acetylmuramoyl-L-alanine amidase [Paenibacillus alvei]MCY9704429.1 N-acetylmuramoyl-L-alanine amidase [Paenibacillus alvei]MCY9736166.1 N-acetylmuramoyl-L-alanine amidase [Paenibacillus alvei]MCY9757374.1 N-acetylmuramoyl-L-alanine amidase [Paenibacillus alvei]